MGFVIFCNLFFGAWNLTMFSDPSYNIEQLDLQSGMKAADLGAGSGFYSFALARAVGGAGKVYAVDVQKELLERLKKEATHQGLHNVEVIWGDVLTPGGTKLRDQSVDAVIAANLLFQLDNKPAFANEVKRILKTKGKLMLVDWNESYGGMGPTAEHVVGKVAGREIFESIGFVFERDIQAGGHHWGLIFRKS